MRKIRVGLKVSVGSVQGLCVGFKVVPHSKVYGMYGLGAKQYIPTCEYIIKSQLHNVTKRCIHISRICFFKTVQLYTLLYSTALNPTLNPTLTLKNYTYPSFSCYTRTQFFEASNDSSKTLHAGGA